MPASSSLPIALPLAILLISPAMPPKTRRAWRRCWPGSLTAMQAVRLPGLGFSCCVQAVGLQRGQGIGVSP
jgi:hypothetical protein